jgi:hypothetical protein
MREVRHGGVVLRGIPDRRRADCNLRESLAPERDRRAQKVAQKRHLP